MEYLCDLIDLSKCSKNKDGVFVPPLCNTCCCTDCTNPIEYMECSIVGITKRCRVFKRNNIPYFVIKCPGFLSEDMMKEEEANED